MIHLKPRPRLARSPTFYVSHFLHISFRTFFLIPTCFGRGFACAGTSVGDSPTIIRLHARHAQRTLEQTLEASKTGNVELKAQAYLNHTSGCISQRWFQIARSFITKGCSAVNQQVCSSSLPSDVRRNSRKSRRASRYYHSSLTWRIIYSWSLIK